MRRLAAQIARWRQPRVPESSSKLPPALTPEQSQTAKRARTQIPPTIQENGLTTKIRVFEQDDLESTERTELDPEEEDNGERRAVAAEIRKLRQEIKDIEDPFSPNNPVMKSLSKEKQASLLRIFSRPEEHEQSEATEQDTEETSEAAVSKKEKSRPKWIDDVQLVVAREHQIGLKKFNAFLQDNAYEQQHAHVARGRGKRMSQKRAGLWIWYNRCKNNIPYFLSAIHPQAWEILWDSQSSIPFAATCAAHLRVISEDLLAMKGTLDPQQDLKYINCLDTCGEKARAIESWKACEIDLENPGDVVTSYLSLGLRLYSTQGNLEKAKELAAKLLERRGIQDYRSIKPMILAQSKIAGEDGAKKAWMSYLVLKQGLGENMSMEDYDNISVGFLKTGRPELALAVFKDMMLSQETSQYDSERLYYASRKHIRTLQKSALTESDLKQWSLGAMLVLPRRLQNKYFYGSWLKKLIGMQDLDAAAKVVDLMFKRGIQPDSRHMNGMIGAWLRLGTQESRQKAQSMAWAMIRARVDFVSGRSQQSRRYQSDDLPSSVDDIQGFSMPDQEIDVPIFIRRDIPRATVETFALMIQYHSRRDRKDDTTNHLLHCMRIAEIPSNSYIMNHLLYRGLRNRDLKSVVRIFDTMSPPVQSDLETFACFWDCSKLNYTQQKLELKLKPDLTPPTDFPTPRAIYRAMVTTLDRMLPRQQAIAHAQFSRELYDQIILCFCLFKDLQGTLIALHSMASRFNMYPDQKTASIVVHRIARMIPVDYEKLRSRSSNVRRRLRRLKGNPEYAANLKTVAQVLEQVHQRRVDALGKAFGAEGLDLEECEDEVQQDHRLATLTDLVMTTLWRVRAEKDDVMGKLERRFKEVGEEMACEVEWFDEALRDAKDLIWEGVFSAPESSEEDTADTEKTASSGKGEIS